MSIWWQETGCVCKWCSIWLTYCELFTIYDSVTGFRKSWSELMSHWIIQTRSGSKYSPAGSGGLFQPMSKLLWHAKLTCICEADSARITTHSMMLYILVLLIGTVWLKHQSRAMSFGFNISIITCKYLELPGQVQSQHHGIFCLVPYTSDSSCRCMLR